MPKQLTASRFSRTYRYFSGLILIALLGGSVAALPYLSFYYGTLPWHKYPIELQNNTEHWQSTTESQHTLATLLVNSAPSKQSISTAQVDTADSDMVLYRISAQHSRHFCSGDEVLLMLDKLQARGLLLLKIAPGKQQPHAQIGIRLFSPFAIEFSQQQTKKIYIKRLTYRSGDWLGVNCQHA